MDLIVTDSFEKKTRKFLKRHPDLKERYKNVLSLLINDYKNPTLKLHKLKGELSNFWSVSLDYENRIILLIEFMEEEIILIDIGNHDDVY